MAPVQTLHFTRDFDSEDEFLKAEAWTLSRRLVVLLEPVDAPPGELIRFEIALKSGKRIVRAEGNVVGPTIETGGRPSGVEIRLRRFDASTKAFIERIEGERRKGDRLQRVSERPELRGAQAERPPSGPPVGRPATSVPPARRSLPPPPRPPELTSEGNPPPSLAQAPPNRDSLLARLRQRRSQ